jgi:hypothetical protein
MPYELKEFERTTPAMVYLSGRMAWGELVHPEAINPQIWLKNTMAPEFLHLSQAQMIVFGADEPARAAYQDLYVPLGQVLAFHLLPPFDYVPDYDEHEPNRAMVDVHVSCDIFRFEGLCRIATIAEFSQSIAGFRQPFRPFYAVSITHPTTPSMEPLVVPYVLVRTENVTYMLIS